MRNQTGDIAGVIFGLLLLVGLSQTYAAPPLGFDMADNPFHPYSNYNPTSQAGTCYSNDPCQDWDFVTNNVGIMIAGTGTCAINTLDTDGDTTVAYRVTGGFNGDWSNIDAGCVVLEDWDQDGTCDHRVYDADRDQVMTDYEPVSFYHQYAGSGMWGRIVSPTLCTSWVGV